MGTKEKKGILKDGLLSVLLLFLFSSPVFPKAIILDDAFTEKSICPFVQYLEDRKGNLTLDDIRGKENEDRWISSERETLGFGFTDSVYWIRFNIKNASGSDKDFFIEQAYPLIFDIKLYAQNNNSLQVFEAGETRPYSQRLYNHRTFVFPLKIRAGSSATYYMRYATEGSLNVVLKLSLPGVFKKRAFTEYMLLAVFFGIILIMIFYNFFLYFFVRRVEYIYYVFFILIYLLLLMSLNGTAFQFLWPDSPRWGIYCRPVFLTLLQVFIGLYCIEVLEIRTKRMDYPYRLKMYRVLAGFYLISISIVLFLLFTSIKYAVISAIVSIGFFLIMVLAIGVVLIAGERNRAAVLGLTASAAIIIGGFLFVFRIFGFLPSNFFTEWSMYIGSVLMVIIFSYTLADRINTMSFEIKKTEEKYRNLVESSDDIIFSLDANANFLSVNLAVYKHLGFTEEDVLGKNFLDLIHETAAKSNRLSREIINDLIKDLKNSKKSITFNSDFKTKYSNEPRELRVRLEYTGFEKRIDVFHGTASSIDDDATLKFMKMERQILEADNFIYNAEILSQKLTSNLNKFLKRIEVSKIRNSLREILINSIEHGNLSINFEEKSRELLSGNYLKYLEERLQDARFRAKKLHIDYLITERKVVYVISDEGDGFDHKSIVDFAPEKARNEMLPHGRGLMMVKDVFNDIIFNEKGNRVTLVKYFNN